MKKFILILKFTFVLVALIRTNFSVSAQTAGDYRSIASGNWNDPTKWEKYNGSVWISSTSYPGQSAGTGSVTISKETEIAVTASVPNAVASLNIDADTNQLLLPGRVTLSSQNPLSLIVAGDMKIHGVLQLANQTGAKTHSLSVGGNFEVGIKIFDPSDYCVPYIFIPGTFQPVNQDDKLRVIFNGAGGWIDSGPGGIDFQDVTFNGTAFTVITPVFISGNANFINGIVTPLTAPSTHNADCQYSYSFDGSIFFYDGATVSGASNASFVNGVVSKGGNDVFTFPIGNGSVYAPLSISAPGDPSAYVSALYQRSNASDLGSIGDPGIFNISNCEYWSIDGLSTSYPLNVTVGWSSSSGCSSSAYVTNASDVTLAHFNFTTWKWDSHFGTGVGTTTTGSVTWNSLTTSGTFTLANLGGVCNAPWGSVTNISSNSANLTWTAVGNSVGYDVDYKPYTSGTWINAATATTSTSVTLSGLSSWMYYDWRIRTNCGSSSSPYRQSQFQTLCGPASGLTTTNVTGNSATLSWSPLASGVSYNAEYKLSTSNGWLIAATGLTIPSYTIEGLKPGTTYDWRVVVNCTVSTQGGYAQSSFTTLAIPTCNDVYEPNNASNQATPLVLENTISALVSSSTDIDWFKVTIPGSSNFVLAVSLSNPPADYDLYVYNKNLVQVGSSTTAGNEVVQVNVRGKNLVYYIKVIGKGGAHNPGQCYNLRAYKLTDITNRISRAVNSPELTDVSDKVFIYPNPASEFVRLRFNSDVSSSSNVQILNSVGQLVKQQSINIVKGFNDVQIAIDNITPGMYILKVNGEGVQIMRKIAIVNR